MVIKKFQAETEEEAIIKAKEELGKDAIVMNIKMVKPKGIQKFFRKPTVEVTAAVDEETSYNTGEEMLNKMQELQKNLQEAQKKENEEQKKKKEEVLKDSNNIIQEEEKETTEKETMGIEDRLDNLQQMLEKQMSLDEKEEPEEEKQEAKEESKADACMRLVRQQLVNNEVEEKYAEIILDEIKSALKKDAGIDNVLASIYQKIVLKLGQAKVIEGDNPSTKFVYFIGPTGVGKTTTIAKIASNLKIQLRKKPVENNRKKEEKNESNYYYTYCSCCYCSDFSCTVFCRK